MKLEIYYLFHSFWTNFRNVLIWKENETKNQLIFYSKFEEFFHLNIYQSNFNIFMRWVEDPTWYHLCGQWTLFKLSNFVWTEFMFFLSFVFIQFSSSITSHHITSHQIYYDWYVLIDSIKWKGSLLNLIDCWLGLIYFWPNA